MKTSSLIHPVRKVPDFWGNAPIEVRVCESDRDLKATVAMSQVIGSLSLCHHMTPAQAREMADALVSAADFIDPVISAPVNVSLSDGLLQPCDHVGPSVWLDPLTAARHGEQRRIELVEALTSVKACLGGEVDGVCDVPGDAVKALDQGIGIGFADGHIGAPLKTDSLGGAA